jgi:3-dehydroquinate synthase
VIIRHQNGSYPVSFVRWSELDELLPDNYVVLTDAEVAALWKLPGKRPVVTIPAGEASKDGATFLQCHSDLAKLGLRRQGGIIAIGGGVVGDLGGFVAATYQRGVGFIQIPTTLLAMVDSSVGGKVAIDLPEGKNLVGAFYPPQAVYVALETLASLSEREYRSGLAEALKYGFIGDPDLLDILKKGHLTESTVARCIAEKQRVVEADEFETLGVRATLNYGHTVGHALEQLTGYADLKHGEAISIGMVVEAELGEFLAVTEPGTADVVREILSEAGLPVDHPLLKSADELIEVMRRDKKGRGTELAFSFLLRIGECKLFNKVDHSRVREFLIGR